MKALPLLILTLSVLISPATAQDQTMPDSTGLRVNALFDAMIGRWEGTCRTWFEPGKLSDESTVTGEITPVFEDGSSGMPTRERSGGKSAAAKS